MLPITYLHFETLSSTNTWVKGHAQELDPTHITCVIADTQTEGRGRNNRPWVAPKGNLYMSLFLTLPKNSSYLLNIGQLLSLVCAEEWGLSIKWPNDLVVDGKKIGGILTETISLDGRLGVIIGLGLNVNILPEVEREVASLRSLKGKMFDIRELARIITSSFAKELPALEQKGFSVFHTRYEKHLAYKGEKISFHQGDKKIEGVCEGVTEDGRLKLKTDQTITLISGEIG
ncbi:MAG: biotin--[acetyl-CoA-carboxylase] ligase [Verrucomicrobia bacterium]|nr:biotin--[acetyl-CoA-carboxylase] ligase [Verrucomicrobiota bacterium]